MKKVIVYTTPTCPYCQMVEEFLKEKDIEFEEKDVAADEEARKELVEKSHQLGVPVIDVDGEVIVGFNREALTNALELSK